MSTLAALTASFAMVFKLPSVDAQQAASPRHIGVLLVGLSPDGQEAQKLRQALQDAGYVDGRDLVIEWRSANGDYDRIDELVADLVQRQVEVIVVENTAAALALKRATSTIPIVMAIIADPIGSGLVDSLAHPGANVTGLSMMLTELSAKRLQLLKEVLPQVTRVGVLFNPTVQWHPTVIEELKVAAPSLSIELSYAGVRAREEIGPAFSGLRRARVQALYVIEDPIFRVRTTLFQLAANARLPTIHGNRQYVDAGGLFSYGAAYGDLFRRSAGYVDRILKGAKPSNLPIEQPTKFDLVVNLKTAKALGITISQSLLLRADEVIR